MDVYKSSQQTGIDNFYLTFCSWNFLKLATDFCHSFGGLLGKWHKWSYLYLQRRVNYLN
jgi:hypothetical protein